MPGPKPKPTHLKILAGNPGKRALPKNEPKPVGELSEPPPWFTESQKEGWNYAIKNAPPGLLKNLDRSVLSVWVVSEDLHRQASEKIAAFGMITKSPDKGVPMQNPFLPILNKQAQIMLKAAGDLGFTPAGRTRIAVGDGGESEEEEKRFFGS